ncbi:MAG: SDR family oxidoreductase [Caulobacterales bacterium]|nr:SDR family oxidoreductase [Caulobacterales bacterium]
MFGRNEKSESSPAAGRLAGKVVVVTGSAQGIGAELAKGAAAAGAKVVVCDVIDTAASLAAITGAGGQAIAAACDVTDAASLEALVAQTEEAFGPVTTLVNNAGVFAGLDLKPFTAISEDEWDRVMRVNVRGVFQATKAVVPSMRKAGGGSIVNIGSGTVWRGAPLFMHYVASKGAVLAMSRVMARELAEDDIRANCVAVGFTASEGVKNHPEMMEKFGAMTVGARMIKREMTPGDLVGTVIFLASEDSAFITGQTFNVDGGAVTY